MDRLDTPALATLLARVLIRGVDCAEVLARRLPSDQAARVRAAQFALEQAAGLSVGILEGLAQGDIVSGEAVL